MSADAHPELRANLAVFRAQTRDEELGVQQAIEAYLMRLNELVQRDPSDNAYAIALAKTLVEGVINAVYSIKAMRGDMAMDGAVQMLAGKLMDSDPDLTPTEATIAVMKRYSRKRVRRMVKRAKP